MCFDCGRDKFTRRDFLIGSATGVAGLVFGQRILAQKVGQSDAKVITEQVSFKNGEDIINGYLTRPDKKGRFRAIIIMDGNPGVADWVKNLSADLSRNDYAALTIDIGSRQEAPRPPDEYIGRELDERVTKDILAGIDYLQARPFVKRGGMGMVGFCFGGRKALMVPTVSKAIKAGVSFYGAVVDHRRYIKDPRPDVITVAPKLRIPIQGHYGMVDPVAVAKDAKEFEALLKKQGTPVEMYYYEGAGHGFYGNTWDEQTPQFGFNAEAAKLARERMISFLKRYLK